MNLDPCTEEKERVNERVKERDSDSRIESESETFRQDHFKSEERKLVRGRVSQAQYEN